MPEWINSLNTKIDEAFELTQLPQLSELAAGTVSRGFDRLVGTNIEPIARQIGRDLPRMTAESIATLPMAGSVAGAPAAAGVWMNRLRRLGQIAGYTDAAISGTAQTDSLAGGAINAATLGLGNKFFSPAGRRVPILGETMDVGEYGMRAGDKLSGFVPKKVDPAAAFDLTTPNLMGRSGKSYLDARDTYQKLMAGVGRGTVDIGAATALNEASRQGMLSVGPGAVGLDDPSRNPLTAENITGNILNAAPMMIGAGIAAKEAFQGDQVKALSEWQANRKVANQADAQARLGYEYDGTMTATEYYDAFGKLEGGPVFRGEDQIPVEEYWGLNAEQARKMEAGEAPTKDARSGVRTMLKSRLDLLKTYEMEGNVEEAERSMQAASDILSGRASGLFTPEGLTMMKDQLVGADEAVRQNAPDTPDDLSTYITQVNELVDQANTGTSSVLVGQMAKAGMVEYITRAELKDLQEIEVQKTGDIQHSYRVAMQTATNRVIEGITKRILRETAEGSPARQAFKGRPPDPAVSPLEAGAPGTKARIALDATERAYVGALSNLPDEVKELLIDRSIEIRSEDAAQVGSQRRQSREPRWRDAVLAASKSSDPLTAFRALIAKDDRQKYIFEPKQTNIAIAEGGKSAKETNEFGEGRTIEDLPGLDRSVATTEQAEVLSPDTAATRAVQEKYDKDRVKLEKVIPNLTDDDLALVGETAFKLKPRKGSLLAPDNSKKAAERKPMYRSAIIATMENFRSGEGVGMTPAGQEFLQKWYADGTRPVLDAPPKEQLQKALRQFWGYQTNIDFPSTLKVGDGINAMHQRLGHIVTKLLDERTIDTIRRKSEMNRGGAVARKGDYGGGVPTPGGQRVLQPEVNTLTDTTPPGSLTADVYATFRDRFDTILGEQGYSGTMRDMMTEAAVAIVQQLPEKMVDFYRVVNETTGQRAAGLAMHRQGRGKLGIDMLEQAPSIGMKSAMQLLHTLAHEVSHIDSFIAHGLINAPDAFSDRRRLHKANLDHLAGISTVDARAAMLTTLRDSLIPPEFRNLLRDPEALDKPYGSVDPNEFTAEINALVSMSLLFGKKGELKTRYEVLNYAPTEVSEFARGTMRQIGDILEGMKGAVTEHNPALHKFVTSELFSNVVENARAASKLQDSDRALAQAKTFVASASSRSGNSPPMVTEAMWFHTAGEVSKQYAGLDSAPMAQAMPNAVAGIRAANQYINSRAYDRATLPGIWARWFYPFTNLMESMQKAGFDLARPMGDVANGVEAGVTRLRSDMLTAFTMRDKNGKMAWEKDNDLINRIQEGKTGPWRDTFNDLSAWQQRNKSQSMFVVDPTSGQVIVNQAVPGAQAKWDASRQRLSAKDQQAIMSGMVAMDRTEQIKAGKLVESLHEGNAYRIARVLMGADRAMFYDQADALSRQVLAAYSGPQINAVALQQLLPNPRLRQTLDQLLAGPEGLVTKTKEVEQKLQSRPGYRTEALPFDWILRYADSSGTIQYLSAKSKLQGDALMAKLKREGMTQQGEVINKRDLREMADFDDPATLLDKYTELETKQWGKFVDEIETAFGPAFAAEMQGYVPGAATAKELSVQGLKQFLVERKNLVDRGRFDYIDGTMASVDRLSASIGFKASRNRKDLMLADPRSKRFPSFGTMVNEHFERMMEPSGQGAKELKTFSTAMMMGASFASVAVNLSQSIISLVPVLIQHDKASLGPVGAWKNMSKAIAHATDISLSNRWKSVAEAARTRDPTGNSWTLAETRAAAYDKSLREGGIDHGIILDSVFTPLDQNTAVNAKFGRGDYGPTTLLEKVRSPVFMMGQLSLKPFGMAEKFNNKIALMAGVDQAYAQGLRGEKLYAHAKLVKNLATYGGGKANAIGFGQHFQSTPFSRSAFGVVNNLQQYGYGIVATYAQLMKDALGGSKGLTPMERRQATKAFATMFATQVSVAGALGLPFAAAALTAIEKTFGIPANQLVREGLASISADEEAGAEFAEMALNGIGNQMLGFDISSRLGVSNLLGTSSYRGFNLADMAGPTGSIATNVIKSLGYFGGGEPMKAAKEIVPNSFRNAVMMSDSHLKYGDLGIRDAGDNLLYQPTPSEAAKYLFGFRPKALSQKKQAQSMMAFAEQRGTKQYGGILDEHSRELLQGDPTKALQYAYGLQAQDPTIDPQSVLQSIVKRGVDAVSERDLMAAGSRATEGDRSAIARLAPQGVINRQSEIQRTLLGMKLGAQVGLMPDVKQLKKAALIDAMVQQSNMPRSQALRLAEFLQ